MAEPQLLSTDPHAGALLSTDPSAGQADFRAENAKDAQGHPIVDFLSHFGHQIDPRGLTQLLPWPQAAGGVGLDAPVKAIEALNAAHDAVRKKAIESWNKGDYTDAARHAMNWLLLGLGPELDKSGDEIQAGQYAKGAGDTLGMAAALVGPAAIAKAGLPRIPSVADAADKAAVARAVPVMAPTVGPNKVRFGNMAADVAPRVLRETSAVTRPGVLDQAATKLDAAHAALDSAYDAVPKTRMYPTAPIKQGIEQAIKDLTVSGIGGSVEPATRAARLSSLKQALSEVQGIGPLANLQNLRDLRIAWDQGAKAVFTPAVAPDYLAARGTGSGWADARTALNDVLVRQHPELKPLNADVSLWTKATDVMQAAEEADRVRPKVGRGLMARGLGAMAGAEMGGGWGAAYGAIIAPAIESGLSGLAPAVKLTTARQLTSLADALRAGQYGRAKSLLATVQQTMRAVSATQAAHETPMAAPVTAQESAPQ